jgi:hypothetical protein
MPPTSPPSRPHKPRIFVDVDVLFAGAASPQEHSASLVVLRMAEITLLEAYTCRQVIIETERNLLAKLPRTLPAFRMIVDRCLRLVPDPSPEQVQAFVGLANPFDLPILVAALQCDCPWLVTFNIRHYQPGLPEVRVLLPGDFLLRVRDLLVQLR